MNRILLIGGTGFIGKHLALALSKKNSSSLFVIHKSSLPNKDRIAGVTYYQDDLEYKKPKFKNFFSDKDVVVIMTQPDDLVIKNIIHYLSTANSLKKIVYTSSTLVYPSSLKPQDEKVKPNPTSSYEKGKLNEEMKLSKFTYNAGIQLCIARIGNVYGDVKSRRIIGFIFDAALENKPLKINGNGEQKRDYIYIEDAINFLNFLIFYQQENQKEIFNVCTGKGYTINHVISEVQGLVGHEIPRFNGPPVLEKKEIVGNNCKILTTSDIKVKYDLSAGLKEAHNNYLKSLK